MAVDRPAANIILMHYAQTKLLLNGKEEPVAIQRMAAEIEKGRCMILKLRIGMPIGDPRHVAKVKLTGIENEIEITWRKPLEAEIEPETHS